MAINKHIKHEPMKNNTFEQKVMSYLIKKLKRLELNKTFLFNTLESVNKMFQGDINSKGTHIQLFTL
eukprot:4254550-Ditylum_brightwellii.AAC.1